jgi:hypothetical protein
MENLGFHTLPKRFAIRRSIRMGVKLDHWRMKKHLMSTETK